MGSDKNVQSSIGQSGTDFIDFLYKKKGLIKEEGALENEQMEQ